MSLMHFFYLYISTMTSCLPSALGMNGYVFYDRKVWRFEINDVNLQRYY